MIVNPIIPTFIMGIICIIIIAIKNENKNAFIRKLLISALLFIINLRIMIPSAEVTMISNNLDILFVVDGTISMVANDYSGKSTRLEAVKEDCEYIINKLVGSKFSVISFNNESRLIIPYTTDNNMAVEAVKSIQVMDLLYARGSSLNISKDIMLETLKKSYENKDRKRILFFISDGEITSDEKLESFKDIDKYVDDGAILGYGTEIGGYMKLKDYYTDVEEYVEDKTEYPYKNAVSKIDETNLKKIAGDIGIDYIKMDRQKNIDYKIDEIVKQVVSNEDGIQKNSYGDIYYIFVAPLVVLLISEFMSYKRRL